MQDTVLCAIIERRKTFYSFGVNIELYVKLEEDILWDRVLKEQQVLVFSCVKYIIEIYLC